MPGRPEEPSVSRSHPEHIFKGLTEDPLARAVAEQRAATVHIDGDLENFGRWKKATTPKEPEYMFPELQGLPDEFRRLAAEARDLERECLEDSRRKDQAMRWRARQEIWDKAAQMLEERLNG